MKAVVKRRPCHYCRNAKKDQMKCSGCHQVYYCSRQCQLQDWRAHKPNCKLMANMPLESKVQPGQGFEQLRLRWIKRAKSILPLLVLQSFPEAEFNRQPPKYELVVCFRFNYNYGTFMPLDTPVLLELDRSGNQNYMRNLVHAYDEAQKETKRKKKTHFIHIVFDNYVEKMVCNVDPGAVESICRDLDMGDAEEVCKLFRRIDLSTSLCSQPDNKRSHILESNLLRQFDFFQQETNMNIQVPWTGFVLNAYRMNTRNCRKGTHVLCVYFLFDFELGKIKRFTKYEVITMDEAKTRGPRQGSRAYLCLDEPDKVPILVVEEYERELYQVTARVTRPPKGFQYWTKKKSMHVANQFFRELTELRFPSVGLTPYFDYGCLQ